ncbi:unnamed protein product [Pieris macdunnoughi]|uniref:Endonuclease/exonuclease/phosphatase domain-containing protein n=1 Tax=Pieris macdunnoughi TaxID=345717 RepID=A0A821X0M7_9NEOP|nr:unnamed protein product [Pieris macdunnoughi]
MTIRDSTHACIGPIAEIQMATDSLLERVPTAEIVILGDFNAHHADWLGSETTDHAGRSFHDLALAYDLTQMVPAITRIPDVDGHKPSLLDLLLTSHPENYQVSVDPPLGSSDHCVVRSTVPSTRLSRPRFMGCRRIWHYKSADWDGMRSFFASYPWGPMCFSPEAPDSVAASVAEVVLQGMELFILFSAVPIGGKSQPWFKRSCKAASRRKRECFKAWAEAAKSRDANTSELKTAYNSASRFFKREITKAKSEHIARFGEGLAQLPSGTRAFWSLAKAVQGNFCQPAIPPLHREDDSLAHTAKEKADLLGCLFASNSTLDDQGRSPPTISRCDSSMPEITFRQRAVRKALSSLDIHKSSGPDGIPPIVLRTCAPELAPVLTRLFRYLYLLGTVPKCWKTASIHPIPKKGDRSDPSNYRPIAITSLFSKIMETIINCQLLWYLEGHQLISDSQYGFRRGRSAGDLLVYLTHRWAEAIESKGRRWRTGDTFYTGRAGTSRAVVDEYRNKLVSEVETLLRGVSDWGRQNLVQFNPKKTQVCAFSAKKTPFVATPLFENTLLKATASIGILGVDISNDVQFRGHLEGKAKLASKKLGVLSKARRYFTPGHRMQLYKAQIRPHMEYCSHLWAGAPQYQLLPLDRIQRRAVRIVDDQSLSERHDPLALRRDVGSLCIFYRIYHGECSEELFGLIPAAEFHHRTSRQNTKLHPYHLDVRRSTTERFSRQFLPRTTTMWNQLPTEVFPNQFDLGSFKKRAYQFLKGRQRTREPSGIESVHGRRYHLTSDEPPARLPAVL